jgi:hypothetical protein
MYIINSKSELSELLRQYILTRINIDIDKTRKQQGISNKNNNNNNSLMVEQIEQSDIYVSK